MGVIKELPLKDFNRFVDIATNAFPGFGMNSPEDKKKLGDWLKKVQKLDRVTEIYGYYYKNKLIGGIRLFNFRMNYFGNFIPMGGGGLLAVDLVHKKEHIAKQLMLYFLNYFVRKGTFLASLYPFRPDFYKKMGFGYGAKVSQYVIKPADLPKGATKKHIYTLGKKDFAAMESCYNRIASKTHGLFKRCKFEMMRFEFPRYKIIGYKKGKKVLGYIVFELKVDKGDNILLHDLVINEMFYENRDVLKELLAFLKSQSDQVRYIIYSTQNSNFHFIPLDPRDNSGKTIGGINHQTNQQGVGLVYRILDLRGFFKQVKSIQFGYQTCKIKLNITDTFFKTNNDSYIVHFVNGKPSVKTKGDYDVEINMDISEFSSMIMGVVSFKTLFELNAAEISNLKYIDTVNKLFFREENPYCVTQF
jgi:predicted acetyltransferase